MHKLGTLLLLCILIGTVSCDEKSVIPDKPAQRDFVFDFADMLEPQLETEIRTMGKALQEKTTAELVLVTIPTRDVTPITEVANKLFNSWGLGDAKKQNGCLILLVKDRLLTGQKGKVRIEVGKGLEGRLNDAKCGRVLDDLLLPGFDSESKELTPRQSIQDTYAFLAQEIAEEYGISLDNMPKVSLPPEDQDNDVSPLSIILFLVVFFFIFGGRIGRRGVTFGGFCGGYGGGYSGGGGCDFGGGSSGGGGADR